MDADKLQEMKGEFIDLLLSTDREGVDEFIEWLEESDFFTAPASTNKHGAYEGGLLHHSMSVYRVLQNFSKPLKDLDPNSVIICGLLHDVCKTNFYTKEIRNKKIPGEKRWEEVEVFVIDDTFPFGHGEKSVYLITKHMKLTDEEAMAIRWHMSGYDDAARSYIGGITQSNAFEKYPFCVAMAIADMYAAHLMNT